MLLYLDHSKKACFQKKDRVAFILTSWGFWMCIKLASCFLWKGANVFEALFVNIITLRIRATLASVLIFSLASPDILKIWDTKCLSLRMHVAFPWGSNIYWFILLFEDSANKAAVMFLVVCSQISAKRLSLLVSHKQRAAFYPNGFGGRHHHGRKVTFWMSEGQIVMPNPLTFLDYKWDTRLRWCVCFDRVGTLIPRGNHKTIDMYVF